jgi:membrane protease YdiL (CAAX protease family)
MSAFSDFIKRERLYLLLLAFIMIVNVMAMMPSHVRGKDAKKAAAAESIKAPAAGPQDGAEAARRAALRQVQGDVPSLSRDAALEKLLSENRGLAVIFGLTSLLVIAAILLGLAIDMILAAYLVSGKRLNISTYRPDPARWGAWDVAKVVILFVFFGYIVIMIESVLARSLPIIKDDNFRMILNSSALDAIAVILILYFAVVEHREKLASLGISLKNFARNIFYGVVAYIALIPVLVAVLAAIAFVVSAMKYMPPRQPVVELFLKETDTTFLLYTSVFAAVFGPVIEELFFRGFMYNAFKKRIGVFAAMLVTASAFAALHAHAVGFLPIMILGMLLAYLYEKTGTLVSSITVHAMHNISMVFMVFLVKQLGAG